MGEQLPDTANLHRREAERCFSVAVVTISSSRTLEEDRSGALIERILRESGHEVAERLLIPDEPERLRREVERLTGDTGPDVVVTSGGTGLAPDDVTIETLRPLFERELSAFGPLFALLSFEEVGGAAVLSRATAGIRNRRLIACLPGSPKACRLGLSRLLLPELGHILLHARRG